MRARAVVGHTSENAPRELGVCLGDRDPDAGHRAPRVFRDKPDVGARDELVRGTAPDGLRHPYEVRLRAPDPA